MDTSCNIHPGETLKYSIKEIQKALNTITEHGGPMEVSIVIDPMNRLIFSYTDSFGGDSVDITLFEGETSKMAIITKTTRL